MLPIELIYQELCKSPTQVWRVCPIGILSHISCPNLPFIYQTHVPPPTPPCLAPPEKVVKLPMDLEIPFLKATRAKIYKDKRKLWQRFFFPHMFLFSSERLYTCQAMQHSFSLILNERFLESAHLPLFETFLFIKQPLEMFYPT